MTCHHYTYALKYFKITFYQHLQNCGSSFSFPMSPEALQNHSITSPPFPLAPGTCKSTVIICWRKPCSHYLANTAFLVLTSVEIILFLILCYIGCTLRINYEVGQIHLHFIDDFFSTVNII